MIVKKNSLRFLFWLFFLILLLNVYSYTLPDHYISINVRLLSSIMLLIALFPWVTFFNKKGNGVPFIQLWGLIYAIYFALKVHLIPYDSVLSGYFYSQLSMVEIRHSLEVALLGLCCCYFGYFLLTYIVFNSKSKLPPNYLLDNKPKSNKIYFTIIFYIGVICIILYGFIVLKDIPLRFDQLIRLSDVFALFSIGYLTYLQFSNCLKKKQILSVYIFIIIPRLIFGLSHGASFQLIAPLIIMFIAFSTAKRDDLANLISIIGKLKTNIKLLLPTVIIVAMLLFAFSFGQLSKGTEHRSAKNKNVVEKLSRIPDISRTTFDKVDQVIMYHPLSRVTYGTIVLGKIITKVPDEIAFQKGRTIYPVLFIPIPRLLWPSKPKQMELNEFGREIDMIAYNNRNTSIRPTQIGDSYYNFGVPGVCLMMFMLGLIFACIFHTLGKATHDPIKLAVAIYIAFLLIDLGQDIYAHISSLFWHFLILYFFVIILKQHTKIIRG